MNTNKKAIFGMLVAMVMSLGAMQQMGTDDKQVSKANLQQVSVGAGYLAGELEGGPAGACMAVSAMSGGFATGAGIAAISNFWNPAGWVVGVVVGGAAL